MLHPCFPEGKTKALTLSYDDGQIHDKRLVQILNQNNIKATFHLNSGLFGTKTENDEYLKAEEIVDLYAGHEVSCHGVWHQYFTHLNTTQLTAEVWENRRALERLASYPVCGMSYPFGDYSDDAISILRSLGIEYARTVESTGDFKLPVDFLRWNPTCHQSKASELVDKFLNRPHYAQMSLFYIWGHSFEFARENNWDMIEELCVKLAGKKDVWYATNIDIKRYTCALRNAVMDADGTMIENLSHLTLYYRGDHGLIELAPGKTISLLQE
ncbi:MAG: polysaccharide deacetylase family protein [Acetanaerobacterium sp.]